MTLLPDDVDELPTSVACLPSTTTCIIIGQNDPSESAAAFITTDGGQTWSNISPTFPPGPGTWAQPRAPRLTRATRSDSDRQVRVLPTAVKLGRQSSGLLAFLPPGSKKPSRHLRRCLVHQRPPASWWDSTRQVRRPHLQTTAQRPGLSPLLDSKGLCPPATFVGTTEKKGDG